MAFARIAATLLACGLGYGVLVLSAPAAYRLGIGELHLVVRLGLVLAALGLADALAARLLARRGH